MKSQFFSHLFLSENSQPALWDQMVSGEPTWDNRGGQELVQQKPKWNPQNLQKPIKKSNKWQLWMLSDDYHCDLFIVANLGETLIFFQHNSGVRVTHGFGGSIGATSILPRSSSWRWVFVMKKHISCGKSTRLRFTLGFDSKPQFFTENLAGKLVRVSGGSCFTCWASFICVTPTVVWFCALCSLCSVLTYTKLQQKKTQHRASPSAASSSDAPTSAWLCRSTAAWEVVHRSARASVKKCQQKWSLLSRICFLLLNLASSTWLDLLVISYQETSSIQQKPNQKYS